MLFLPVLIHISLHSDGISFYSDAKSAATYFQSRKQRISRSRDMSECLWVAVVYRIIYFIV
jgi:hypothetical protein